MAADQDVEREVGVEEGERWVTHYSSNHQILLVGEGDFSFSLSLARSFGSASNILASSLDSYDVVIKNYKAAKSNLENLGKLGASLLHGVDATKMKCHTDLKMRKFNRVVFNFPHVGFHGKEDSEKLIQKHRDLVNGFFSNAKGMLQANGEIHVNHKTTAPFCKWNIPDLALKNSLVLVACVDFKKEDFPGYNNKRGNGPRCDEAFPLGECSTFKFRFYRPKKKSHGPVTQLYSSVHGSSQQLQEIPNHMQQCSASINFRCPLAACHLGKLEQTLEHVRLPLTISPIYQRLGIFDGHLDNPTEISGRTNYDLSKAFHATRLDVVRDAEILRRNSSCDINLFGDIYHLSTLHLRSLVPDNGNELMARRDAPNRQYLRWLVQEYGNDHPMARGDALDQRQYQRRLVLDHGNELMPLRDALDQQYLRWFFSTYGADLELVNYW